MAQACISLCGDRVDGEALQALSRQTTLPLLAGQDGQGALTDALEAAQRGDLPSDSLALMLGEVDENRLDQALRPPFTLCIEGRGKWHDRIVSAPLPHQTGMMLLSIRTATAISLPLSGIYCQGLWRFLSVSEERQMDIETAIHETLSNAAVHGNLAIYESHDRDFVAFDRLIRERSANPAFGDRHICVESRWDEYEVVVRVTDQGQGFVPELRPDGSVQYRGRGLQIVEILALAIEIQEGGRQFEMRFARQ